jgi:SHS2 domain-containing protein
VTYEWRSHTAEIELRVVAASEVDVFGEAADAFGRYVELDCGGERARHEVQLEAVDRGGLLVALLEELIFLADTEGFVPDRTQLRVEGNRLSAVLEGRRTRIDPIVKAATYHGLQFERKGEVWDARIVFDV